ncbi:MAG: hypothetical protein FWC67_00675 [Defluviitaleaceae bacterium]|nr:hypothetical protein [Defluviitaleaceae bacterium]
MLKRFTVILLSFAMVFTVSIPLLANSDLVPGSALNSIVLYEHTDENGFTQISSFGSTKFYFRETLDYMISMSFDLVYNVYDIATREFWSDVIHHDTWSGDTLHLGRVMPDSNDLLSMFENTLQTLEFSQLSNVIQISDLIDGFQPGISPIPTYIPIQPASSTGWTNLGLNRAGHFERGVEFAGMLTDRGHTALATERVTFSSGIVWNLIVTPNDSINAVSMLIGVSSHVIIEAFAALEGNIGLVFGALSFLVPANVFVQDTTVWYNRSIEVNNRVVTYTPSISARYRTITGNHRDVGTHNLFGLGARQYFRSSSTLDRHLRQGITSYIRNWAGW